MNKPDPEDFDRVAPYMNKKQTYADGRAKRQIIAVALLSTLVIVSAFGAAFWVTYTFDRDVHSHLENAESASTPAEMNHHFEAAKRGLRERGYGGGQYAYILKKPTTNTTVDYRILDSYIERTETLRVEDNQTEVSTGMTDIRQQLENGRIGIDTWSWWWHQNPLNTVIQFMVTLGWFIYLIVLSFCFVLSGEYHPAGRVDITDEEETKIRRN